MSVKDSSNDMPKAEALAATNEESASKNLTDDAHLEEISMTFPQKLMEILDDLKTNDIITWLPHGRSFIIYKKKKFATEVLPTHFKQSKFTSFTRKLNRWGFTRVTRGPETGAYFHKFFQRDYPRLCIQMCCQNIRLHNEALALHDQAVALNASHTGPVPYGLMSSQMTCSPTMNSMTAFHNNFLQQQMLEQLQQQQQQQQQQKHQLQIQQQQQQLQANEFVRRAMATQATANATHSQLAALMSASMDNNSTDHPSYSSSNSNLHMMDSSLYMELLQNKRSNMNSHALIGTGMLNSLGSAPISSMAQLQHKQSMEVEETIPIDEQRKSRIPRASAA